jgi:hypothetical protein
LLVLRGFLARAMGLDFADCHLAARIVIFNRCDSRLFAAARPDASWTDLGGWRARKSNVARGTLQYPVRVIRNSFPGPSLDLFCFARTIVSEWRSEANWLRPRFGGVGRNGPRSGMFSNAILIVSDGSAKGPRS